MPKGSQSCTPFVHTGEIYVVIMCISVVLQLGVKSQALVNYHEHLIQVTPSRSQIQKLLSICPLHVA